MDRFFDFLDRHGLKLVALWAVTMVTLMTLTYIYTVLILSTAGPCP
jgi:hypothetical protein